MCALSFILLSPAVRAAGEQAAQVIFQRCRISAFSQDLVDIVSRCLETDALNRFQTMDDLLKALEGSFDDYLEQLQALNSEAIDSETENDGFSVAPQPVSARSGGESKILAPFVVIAVGLAGVFFSIKLVQTPDETMRLQRIADRKVDMSRYPKESAKAYQVEDKLSWADDSQRKLHVMRKFRSPDQSVLAVYNEAAKAGKPLGWVAAKVSGIEDEDSVATKIDKLERFRFSNPYDKAVNNELRDLYLSRSPRKSMECCNRILERYPMDDYTLRCLSSWAKGGEDASEAYVNFLSIHKSYPDLKFVNAACLISAGDAAAALRDSETARGLFHQVERNNDEELAEYAKLARERMQRLESSP